MVSEAFQGRSLRVPVSFGDLRGVLEGSKYFLVVDLVSWYKHTKTELKKKTDMKHKSPSTFERLRCCILYNT